jgi:hypothetical protein
MEKISRYLQKSVDESYPSSTRPNIFSGIEVEGIGGISWENSTEIG